MNEPKYMVLGLWRNRIMSTMSYRRIEGVEASPRILDLGTRWRWVVSFTPRPLYPKGRSSRYPLDRRMGGPQSRSGREKFPAPTGTRTPDHPARSPALYRWAITALSNIKQEVIYIYLTRSHLSSPLSKNEFSPFFSNKFYWNNCIFCLFFFFLLSLAPQPSLGLGLLHKIRMSFLEASQQFSFLQGRVFSPTSNPHLGGPGLCICIPQRRGGYPF
jgi:hypothetical protein